MAEATERARPRVGQFAITSSVRFASTPHAEDFVATFESSALDAKVAFPKTESNGRSQAQRMDRGRTQVWSRAQEDRLKLGTLM